MKIMFNMMNEERQVVGTMGVAVGSAAYLHALDYAKQRYQGSSITSKDPNVQVPIIQHPDIRRMLLRMKSLVEGMRILCMYCYLAMDKVKVADSEEEKEKWQGMIEMFTPIVKSYCTEMGLHVNDLAIQTYGGYGYCREYPVEQMMRDQRINTIYEGTNGIQAMDLLGRKVGMKKGRYFMNLLGETRAAIEEGKASEAFKAEAVLVESAVNALQASAGEFAGLMASNPFVPFIGACDFLNCFGDTLCGWFHLRSALVATEGLAKADNDREKMFYTGKIEGARFFINRITALVPAKCANLVKDETSAMRIPEEAFAV
jgi:hypothetical protein